MFIDGMDAFSSFGWGKDGRHRHRARVLPKVINLATHPVGTLLNSFGNGMATVLSKHLPTVVKVMPTTGPTEWLPMIASGEVDFGILNNWDAKNGRYGREEYKAATAGKGSPIFLLCSGTPNLGGIMTSESSGIKKGSDLKGKRVVCIYTGSAGISKQASANLANFGLKTSDVKVVSVPSVEAGVRAIIEGRADATGSVGLGMATNAELEADKGARYLSFDSFAGGSAEDAGAFSMLLGSGKPRTRKDWN